jgi:ABC-type arginine/histidine transport system permease subunit
MYTVKNLESPATIGKATSELINEIVSALKGKLIVRGIFCDLAKAFDCVNHILLSKLNFYGIIGKAYEWTKSFLRNKVQTVEIRIKISITWHFQTGAL